METIRHSLYALLGPKSLSEVRADNKKRGDQDDINPIPWFIMASVQDSIQRNFSKGQIWYELAIFGMESWNIDSETS